MRPVWLCPLRLRDREWSTYPLKVGTTYVNVGFWGTVHVGPEAAQAPRNRAIEAKVLQLGGALVTPAFVDAHTHPSQTGLALTSLDLASVHSLAEALQALAAYARTRGDDVLLGFGWDETGWPEGRPPYGAELDRAVRFGRGAVGDVGMVLVLALEGGQGLAAFPQELVPPADELAPEIVPVALAHEDFVVRRPVRGLDGIKRCHACQTPSA